MTGPTNFGGNGTAVEHHPHDRALAAQAHAFGDLPRGIASALDALGDTPGDTRDALVAADVAARAHVRKVFQC